MSAKVPSTKSVRSLTPGRIIEALRAERSPWKLLLLTIVIFVFFSAAAPNTFPTTINLESLGFQFPEVGLLSLGVMLSMVTSGIDLSMVAIADLAGTTMTQFLLRANGPNGGSGSIGLTLVAIAIALGVGALCGLVNGLLIGKLRITPILATLATFELFGGLAIAWTGGHTLGGIPDSLLVLGNGTLLGIPIPTLLFVVAAVGTALLLNWSRLGLLMTLVGANATAARFSGVRDLRVLIGTYVSSGLLAGLAGTIIVARTASATPDYGQSYILLSVVVAVLAGVDLSGGFGTVAGVVLATLALTFIQTGFVFMGLNQFLYEMAQGLILIIVLGLQTGQVSGLWVRARRWIRPTAVRKEASNGNDRSPMG
ncbi:ABC transporter permease [Ktedonobacteria bacterium brp13]|nr:ABC transporter permease [Ktedonobacteria bacterium brp13]